jgi:hypothetical protein
MCLHSYKSRRENILDPAILSSLNSYPKLALVVSLNDRAFQGYISGHTQNGFEKLLEPTTAAKAISGANWLFSPAYTAAVAFRVKSSDFFSFS